MDKLANYKLDKAFTEGVELRLDNAPDVVFKVRLPSEYNRGYTQAVYGDAAFSLDEHGRVKVDGGLVAMKHTQEDAFVAHCLLSKDGEPIPADFVTHYPRAVEELWTKAQQLAADLDNKVDRSKKKSLISSSGSESGEDESASTPSLSAEAS